MQRKPSSRQSDRIEEIRARYPGFRFFPSEVVMDETPTEHPGLQHCGSCLTEQEFDVYHMDDLCCCRSISDAT